MSTATITAGGTTGSSSITVSAAPTGLQAGSQIRLFNGTTYEGAWIANGYVSPATVIPLQAPIASATTHTSAQYEAYNVSGPGLNGFLPTGVGIEEEAVFDPVTNLFYLERAATQDAMPTQNVVVESGALFNGTTMDRMRSAVSDAMPTTGIAAESEMVFNGTTFDRARSASIGNNVVATGIGADAMYGQFNTVLPTLATGNYSAIQLDSSGRILTTAPAGSATSALQTSGNSSLTQIATNTTALNNTVGPSNAGSPALNSLLVGASFSSAPITLANGQQIGLQVDSAANLKISGTVVLGAGAAAVGSVSVSNFPATQAISAASLPLPLGAATSAKQPALGTAGTASTDVITVQGIASMTALKVDGSAVNQPVTPAKGTLTDRSGLTSATPSTSTTAIAANASRKYLLIQNVSTTATIWVNFTSAATADQPSFQLTPGSSIVQESGFVSTEAVTVLSATASVSYTAKEA